VAFAILSAPTTPPEPGIFSIVTAMPNDNRSKECCDDNLHDASLHRVIVTLIALLLHFAPDAFPKLG
jgi:hypothetical protein